MKSVHSVNELHLNTDQRITKKLSPRNTDSKKISINSPTYKSSLTPTSKKISKEVKKVQEQNPVTRFLPSRSEKILFESSNKLTYKLSSKVTPKTMEKDVIFHRSHQTPLNS
jgi:hypothetical protein